MPREKFGTLTESMFYILLALRYESSGVEVMRRVSELSGERVAVGAGTLYTLLESFQKAGMIKETRTVGRQRCYILTETGKDALEKEHKRLLQVITDYESSQKGE